MPKRIDVSKVEISPAGEVGLLLSKQVVEGQEVLLSIPHRVVITVGDDIDAVLAGVSEHLKKFQGYPALSKSQMEWIQRRVIEARAAKMG